MAEATYVLRRRSASPARPAAAPAPPGLAGPIRIGSQNDSAEREADRAADSAMRGERVHLAAAPAPMLSRKCAGCAEEELEADGEVRRSPQGEAAVADRAPPAVAAALRAPGTPLDAAARAYFEPRFGADFAGVRVHADSDTARAARSIDARAFTLGRRIGFAAGEYAPATTAGRHLLAHELAHVVQAGSELRRQRPGAHAAPAHPLTPPFRSSEELWTDFLAVYRSDPARAAAIARQLIPIMSPAQSRANGVWLLFWLLDNGIRDDAARQLIDNLSFAYTLAWASNTLVTRTIAQVTRPDPAAIVARAQVEARAGRHESASSLFALAFHLCELLLLDLSASRRAELERMELNIGGSDARRVALAEAQTTAFFSPSMASYSAMSPILAVVRDILGFYPREERRALAAGDQVAARQASGLGLVLRLQLLGERSRTEESATTAQVTTMETVAGFNERRQRGYTLHGVTGPQEVVTPLPGTPSPDDLGLFPDLHSSFRTIAAAIAGQEEFLSEIQSEPEVRRVFRSRQPDMTDVNDRLSVWRAMYSAYQRRDRLGLGVLHSLMSLMGRYLRSYTAHTVYNIRDFGVSYLSSRFPTDLVGRTVQDCGVYALTVAYELYRTAREARPRLALDFRLYAQPEHVMLAIFDRDVHYIVSNDQVTPGRPGGPASPELYRSLAGVYGQTFGRSFVITPMQSVSLGTTAQSDSAFRAQAWRHYQVSTRWGFPIDQPAGPQDTRGEGERSVAPYRRYYDDLRTFNTVAARLQPALDAASRAGAGRPAAEQQRDLGRAVGEIFPPSYQAARIFDTYGPHAQTVAADATAQRLLGTRQYLFTHAPGAISASNPLARMAMMLLRFRHLGGSLDAAQVEYIRWVRTVPAFATDVAAYEAAGYPESF